MVQLDLVLSTTSGAAHDSRCDWALWIEPELSCVGADREATRDVPPAVSRVLDLGALGDGAPLATRWDEVNLWKLYTYFGPIRAVRRPQTGHAGWLRERLPWVTRVCWERSAATPAATSARTAKPGGGPSIIRSTDVAGRAPSSAPRSTRSYGTRDPRT